MKTDKLSIQEITTLAPKILNLEGKAEILPKPTQGEDLNRVLNSSQPCQSFLPREIEFMKQYQDKFPKENHPKLHAWLQDTSKLLGDDFKKENSSFKPNERYPLLPLLGLITTLSGEKSAFGEYNLIELHDKLRNLIPTTDQDEFRKKTLELLRQVVASDAPNPILNLRLKLNLPGNNAKWKREEWYEFVLNTGPASFQCLESAELIEQNLKRVPRNLKEARDTLLSIKYPDAKKTIANAKELPKGVSNKDLHDYTEICLINNMSLTTFNFGLNILLGNEFEYGGKTTKIKTTTKIPKVEIDGKDIAEKYETPELAKYRLEILPPQDWRTLVMGKLVNNCQSIGADEGGRMIPVEAITNDNCGIVAIFKGDQIVAESFVWLGKNDQQNQKTFVFDSYERKNENLDFLCGPFYNEMGKKLQASHGIDRVTLGEGQKTPEVFLVSNSLVEYQGNSNPYSADTSKQYDIIDSKSGLSAEKNRTEVILPKIYFIQLHLLISEQKINEFQKLFNDIRVNRPELFANLIKRDGFKLLQVAAKKGLFEVVKELVENKVTVTQRDNEGGTIIHYAASGGSIEVIKLLTKKFLEQKYNLYGEYTSQQEKQLGELHPANMACNNLGGNILPLHNAVEAGQVDVVEYLMSRTKNINAPNSRLFTPLHYAVMLGRTDLAKLLINRGADVNSSTVSSETPLSYAIYGHHIEVAKALAEAGANLYVRNQFGQTLIDSACELGLLQQAKDMILIGLDVNKKNRNGNTPLHIAAAHSFLVVKELLMHDKIDVGIKNNEGKTALDLSASGDIKKLIEDHIKAKAEQAMLLDAASSNTSGVQLSAQSSTAAPQDRSFKRSIVEFSKNALMDVVNIITDGGALELDNKDSQNKKHKPSDDRSK